jgi:membrane protein
VTILWSAGGAARSAMCALGTIYEVKVRAWFSRSVVSFGLTVAFLLCWSLCLLLIPISNTVARVAVGYFGWDHGVLIVWGLVDWTLAGSLVFASILCLNRFGPDVPLRLQALVPGSLVTLGLWITMTFGLSKWMEYSWANYNTTYGALSVVIVLLLWCYLLSIGLLLGAEINTAILRLRSGGLEAAGKGDLHEAIRDAVEKQIEAIPILEESVRKRSL